MKVGDRVICKSDNRHGVITEFYIFSNYIKNIFRYGETDYHIYYRVKFDGDETYSFKLHKEYDLKLESSLWHRIINKLKSK